MILDEQSFKIITNEFMLSNTPKYLFDQLNSSSIINNLSKVILVDDILIELRKDYNFDPLDATVYLYLIVFVLYKKSNNMYKDVLISMQDHQIIYSKEMIDIFAAYGVVNNYSNQVIRPKIQVQRS